MRAALEARGSIIEARIRHGKGKTHYEGQVQPKAGKKVVLELDADGKPIKK